MWQRIISVSLLSTQKWHSWKCWPGMRQPFGTSDLTDVHKGKGHDTLPTFFTPAATFYSTRNFVFLLPWKSCIYTSIYGELLLNVEHSNRTLVFVNGTHWRCWRWAHCGVKRLAQLISFMTKYILIQTPIPAALQKWQMTYVWLSNQCGVVTPALILTQICRIVHICCSLLMCVLPFPCSADPSLQNSHTNQLCVVTSPAEFQHDLGCQRLRHSEQGVL